MTVQDYGVNSPARNRRIPKVAELVAAELRQKILRGEVAEGESLSPEAVLVEEYGVSRPSLREALRLLEQQGLIAIRRGSHKGPVAARPDSDLVVNAFTMILQLRKANLADIYRFRMIFEPVAARMAAESASDSDIESLKSLLAAEKDAVSDGENFGELAWRFHSELVRMSGNITMALLVETLEKISGRHASAALMRWDDKEEQRGRAYRAHRRMVGFIERHEGDKAEQFWAKHMAEVGKLLLENPDELSIIEFLD
ncbi:FadR/GntR family transcriptional regulator [Rhodococcus koreensis]|uniref:FadR/GntR family transcriptional regulator n=1 Tax=Rhodococcus koreensis TaxID=99653 RepID=UPI00367350F8